MIFPLGLRDISLLFAIIALILIVTSELLSLYVDKVDILIDNKKLRNGAVIASIIFIITVVMEIGNIILTS